MGNTFLANAQRQTTDIRTFLREVASDTNGIKYRAESGKRHQIYTPYIIVQTVDESGSRDVPQIIAVNAPIHEWQGKDNKFKSMICLKDNFRQTEDGQILNDGTCPFCDCTQEAWDIYRYRYDLEEKAAIARGLNGEALDIYMKGDKKNIKGVNSRLLEDRKAREVKWYLYMLVVKYRMDANGAPMLGDKDKLPEFDLKVMKLSPNRSETILTTIENSGGSICGAEIVFDYPQNDDPAQVVGQSSIAVVFPGNKLVDRYPGLIEKINEQVSQFSWEGIEKAFPELEGMTVSKAKEIMDDSFDQWRKYQAELNVNPNAKYLEYNVANNDKPAINGVQMPMSGASNVPMPNMGAVNTGIQMPNAAGIPMPQAGANNVPMPQATQQFVAPQSVPQESVAPQVQNGSAVQQFSGAGVKI